MCPAVCISDGLIKVGMCAKYQRRHEPSVFCSSLIKSEPTWLHPEEVNNNNNDNNNNDIIIIMMMIIIIIMIIIITVP